MAETNTPSVKKYYDYAQKQVDEQAILDKYNAATAAQFAAQREQNRQTENAFYNQMYDTQKTAMDTIRQSNAAAVSSGASRGVQAANELSALLGLQQESVQSATELANANRQTAQEETAAVLENVLNAYQQATQERQQLVQQGIESASVDVEKENVQATQERANIDALQSALKEGTTAYFLELEKQGKDYAKTYSLEGEQSLLTSSVQLDKELAEAKKNDREGIVNNYLNIAQKQYGISQEELDKAATALWHGISVDSPEFPLLIEGMNFNKISKDRVDKFIRSIAEEYSYGELLRQAYKLKQNRK